MGGVCEMKGDETGTTRFVGTPTAEECGDDGQVLRRLCHGTWNVPVCGESLAYLLQPFVGTDCGFGR